MLSSEFCGNMTLVITFLPKYSRHFDLSDIECLIVVVSDNVVIIVSMMEKLNIFVELGVNS